MCVWVRKTYLSPKRSTNCRILFPVTRNILLVLLLGVLVPVWPASEEFSQQLKRIFNGRAFTAKRFGPARWIENGAGYSTVEGSELIRYDTATGKRSVLVSAQQLTPPQGKALALEDYEWSADGNRLLIFTETKKVWRLNTRGDYWVLDLTAGSLKKLGAAAPPSSLMFAKFSPDASRVAYVRANNIYVENLKSGEVKPLTSDGSETLINGTSDWVYEEELFLRDGFRWSPDGASIAFWQFDSTGVERFSLINNTDSLYPKITTIAYPKVGTKNSAARLGVVPASGGAPRWMEIPGDPRNHYLAAMEWRGGTLEIQQLNRKQNTLILFSGDARTAQVKEVFRDHDDAWVDMPEFDGEPPRLNGGKDLLWLSERDGWNHAYAVPAAGGTPVLLTPGAMDVVRVVGVDKEARWLYFIASPDNATQRYLYRTPMDRSSAPVRLTPADQPGTHTYRMSPDGRWAFHTWSRFDRPVVTDLIRLPDHQMVRMLEPNAALRGNVASITSPPVEFFQVQLEAGIAIDGWMLKPRNFDPSKKYPVVVHVYGEPASVTVTDAWGGARNLFHRALANEGYLVVSFDNRGTPAPKGRQWRKSIYGAVGLLASQDQAEALLALGKARPYVDLTRAGVWGWSGGGSNTLNMMFRAPDLYKVGVSVAPVPDQKLYDTIYQERYMGLPDENEAGYKMGSSIHFAEGLMGKLLIVHGSGDDNVHYQGTEKLVNRLIELGKPFDFMAYPNRSHSINEGPGTSLHLYSLIGRYFFEHLPAGPR
jgi:dipeptidyl-peptidase-4